MKWFKRYALGCLITLSVFAGADAYARPGKDPPVGAIVALTVVWPITAAIAVGSFIGEVAREINQGSVG